MILQMYNIDIPDIVFIIYYDWIILINNKY